MSRILSFEGHFDGKALVPHGPVSLPLNRLLTIRTSELESGQEDLYEPQDAGALSDEERMAAFDKLMDLSENDPLIPVEALRRINLYEEDET